MQLCKNGQIANCCGPNALMTLEEYISDYASSRTRQLAEPIIERELSLIPNPKVQSIARERIQRIKGGERDFRL